MSAEFGTKNDNFVVKNRGQSKNNYNAGINLEPPGRQSADTKASSSQSAMRHMIKNSSNTWDGYSP